ncbi:hypothetical protein [Streptomyces sp. 3N207]|uniref:hypothetical protein n=1 Tax=Streptomyces sp. 3N207 TaxID=3457417 RepID=UPI003FD459EA
MAFRQVEGEARAVVRCAAYAGQNVSLSELRRQGFGLHDRRRPPADAARATAFRVSTGPAYEVFSRPEQ